MAKAPSPFTAVLCLEEVGGIPTWRVAWSGPDPGRSPVSAKEAQAQAADMEGRGMRVLPVVIQPLAKALPAWAKKSPGLYALTLRLLSDPAAQGYISQDPHAAFLALRTVLRTTKRALEREGVPHVDQDET